MAMKLAATVSVKTIDTQRCICRIDLFQFNGASCTETSWHGSADPLVRVNTSVECEERNDEAIQRGNERKLRCPITSNETAALDCFASLAMTECVGLFRPRQHLLEESEKLLPAVFGDLTSSSAVVAAVKRFAPRADASRWRRGHGGFRRLRVQGRLTRRSSVLFGSSTST